MSSQFIPSQCSFQYAMFPFSLAQGLTFQSYFLLFMFLTLTLSCALALISPIPGICLPSYSTCSKTVMLPCLALTPPPLLIPDCQMKRTSYSSELLCILHSQMKPLFASCDGVMYNLFLHQSVLFFEIQTVTQTSLPDYPNAFLLFLPLSLATSCI